MHPGPRLTAFGTGYLGLAHAACLAEAGLRVLAVDTDAALGHQPPDNQRSMQASSSSVSTGLVT